MRLRRRGRSASGTWVSFGWRWTTPPRTETRSRRFDGREWLSATSAMSKNGQRSLIRKAIPDRNSGRRIRIDPHPKSWTVRFGRRALGGKRSKGGPAVSMIHSNDRRCIEEEIQ
jgi:hypothetical protein